MIHLPKLTTREVIAERLPLIFPVGTPNRNNCVRDIAVNVVYVMLYTGSVGTQHPIAPRHVYRMTEEQAVKTSDQERLEYYLGILGRGKYEVEGKPWYKDNTRESVRDETIRDGLVQLGAVLADASVPTTSSKPRYALQKEFADLFNPDLNAADLEDAIKKWQKDNLSASALARLKINLSGAEPSDQILVRLPNGITRHLEPGPSSVISKHVVEEFAPKFLHKPFLLWLSTSGHKAVYSEDQLARSLGLSIDVSKDLPDIILVDLGPEEPLFIFTEVVATDGAITPRRMDAIYELTDKAGFSREQVLFVTAYMDRQTPGFKKTVNDLSWNSFIWFASEPDHLGILHGEVIKLSDAAAQLRALSDCSDRNQRS